MLRRLLGFALLALFSLTLTAPAQDKKKNKDDKTPPPIDADNLAPADYFGTIGSIPDSNGNFVVTLEIPHLVLKAGAAKSNSNNQLQAVIKEQAHVAQLQTKLTNAKNEKEQGKAYSDLAKATTQLETKLAQAIAKGAPNPFKVQVETKDFTFHAAPNYKVRWAKLPTAFDEKGNPKTYTDEEIKELRGTDKNLPGYEAKTDDLSSGQKIRVTLAVAPTKKKVETASKESTDKAETSPSPPDPKTQVKVIVIVEDSDSTTTKPAGKDKKK